MPFPLALRWALLGPFAGFLSAMVLPLMLTVVLPDNMAKGVALVLIAASGLVELFAVPVAIFLLLFATFGRIRQAALVIMNVPFALVGGIAALWLRQLNLNLSASVGFIALFGVAVLNGVVLVAAVNKLREEGAGLRHSILAGASTRLKPVLMTALVASFGFIPMALSHGSGAEIQRPLATVVIGGIVTQIGRAHV